MSSSSPPSPYSADGGAWGYQFASDVNPQSGKLLSGGWSVDFRGGDEDGFVYAESFAASALDWSADFERDRHTVRRPAVLLLPVGCQ